MWLLNKDTQSYAGGDFKMSDYGELDADGKDVGDIEEILCIEITMNRYYATCHVPEFLGMIFYHLCS